MPRAAAGPVSSRLPDVPWDALEPAKAVASGHPDGLVDLSMGTPVDPVPQSVRAALAAAADAPGYPPTIGTPALRAAISGWVSTVCGAPPGFGVVPTIGSKELVAGLPAMLGIGPGDIVVVPSLCYPTYEVGALLVGATVVRADSLVRVGPSSRVRLIWVNSPSNPTGQVLPAAHLRKTIDWARERGAIVASDECYLSLGWSSSASSAFVAPSAASSASASLASVSPVEPVSALSLCGSSYDGVLTVHSLSKRSNLAGYRAGFVAGDPALVAELIAVRKHAGMLVPAPVQAAMVAALGDEGHVVEQRSRYQRRRALLLRALAGAGFRVEHSEAGLFLWATRDEPCWSTVDWFASRGILVVPGVFYGPTGDRHVRLALTESDERIESAASRLS